MAILVVICIRWPKSQSQICDIDSEPRDVKGLGREVDGGRRTEFAHRPPEVVEGDRTDQRAV
jgi:hypothetical protein